MHDEKHSIPRTVAAASLVCSLLGSCAMSPHAAPVELCRGYESPLPARPLDRVGLTIDDWDRFRFLSLREDWTCTLTHGNGAYPIGRWQLVTTWHGSQVVLVWPVGPQTLGDPTPPGDFLRFVVVQRDGHVGLQRHDRVWMSR